MFPQISKTIIDALYPRRCPICHEIVTPAGGLICSFCLAKIHIIRNPVCKKCGKEVLNSEIEYCFDCNNNKRTFNYGLALTRYDDLIKQSITSIKYGNKREYLDFYSAAICQRFKKQIRNMKVELLVPVPIHKKRRRVRGFNQAEILAQGIGSTLNIPVVLDGLIRNKNTDPQKQLGSKERLKNLEKAFTVKKSCFKGKQILLVDDIYTTGSTIEACSRVLKDSGAKNIYFIAICIGGNEG